ncbi:DUF2170 family protein [Halomonas sp. 328]|uniref:DUF2170 family protein n=1 Tax=Halomonas sp. 328 TaxID=2776704 RepID=UPI0018A77BB2|nr:DUF2170 family protein [Halomonas sp. 328]MBF8223772.1 DUF2170 family protein [Halomonas sp. 328]
MAPNDTQESGLSIAELFEILTRPERLPLEGGLAWPLGDFELDMRNHAIAMSLDDYSSLSMTITRQSEQWVVMAPIAPLAAVASPERFNAMALRLGMAIPLASIGLTEINGQDYYVAYGQLFAESKPASICSELHATAGAALQAAELLQDELR